MGIYEKTELTLKAYFVSRSVVQIVHHLNVNEILNEKSLEAEILEI